MDDLRALKAAESATPSAVPGSWADALLAADLLKLGGAKLGGLWIKARAGGVRDAYLEHLAAVLAPEKPWVRLPASPPLSALTGGTDIPATALAGRIVTQPGLLAKADGTILLVPMAERVEAPVAAVIGETMDTQSCARPGRSSRSGERDLARVVVVALDESAAPEEHLPVALADRLGLMIDLNGVSWGEVAANPSPVSGLADPVRFGPGQLDPDRVTLGKELMQVLSRLACAAGVPSLRSLRHLSHLTRTLAAGDGRDHVGEEDVLTALRLCLGLNLSVQEAPPPDEFEQMEEDPSGQGDAPPPPPAADTVPPQDPETSSPAEQDFSALNELVAAVEAGAIEGLPDFTHQACRTSPRARSGKSGAARQDARRGRPVSTSRTPPRPDARPNVLATLRAAAPWQVIRTKNREVLAAKLDRSAALPRRKPRTLITRDDYRYQRLRHETPSTAVFIVDASGSTALERLGETKGAIERLLAQCYVRRDEVAMIAFRGTGAETILPPTRSLVMAKRKLAGLPGGGPTPLASGLERGLEMALTIRSHGSTPVLVLLTDGRGNIALDGTPDRAKAAEQLESLATRCRSLELQSICIDIARRPRESVASLAASMGADLHVLRHADARAMSDMVNASMQEARS